MKSKLLASPGGERTFALIFETGDEVMTNLKRFAQENKTRAAHFTAIGAFRRAVLAYFDWDKKDYKKIPVNEQVEVLTLAGDVAWKEDGSPAVHAHVVLGRSDGSTCGGHLMEAHVRPTLELILTETPQHLQRKHDAETGLTLIRV
jgi:predicted DNA-binding protein with PD1-like motif